MASPKVVAKGADYMAFRIREIAVASGVPIVEKPALARAMYAGVEVGPAHLPRVLPGSGGDSRVRLPAGGQGGVAGGPGVPPAHSEIP
jgi:flagellar biosynthetic protein FlhB